MANEGVKEPGVDNGRRRFLTATTAVVGAVGVGFAATPFIASWQPSARAKLAGAPVTVDITGLQVGQRLVVEWRGQPVWIVKRSQAMLDALHSLDPRLRDPESKQDQQPAYIKGEARSFKPEISVLVGVCTHLGCAPEMVAEIRPEPYDPQWKGGYFCPCHKSRYDMAGRVFQGVPAPLNLLVPPHHYADDHTIVVGVDPQGGRVMPNDRMPNEAAQNDSTIVQHDALPQGFIAKTIGGLQDWFNARAPAFGPFYKKHMTGYFAPKNFNIWYIFGVLSLVVLVNQLLTGIFLTMHFKTDANEAFASIEYIMRDVPWGWLIRYMHSTGASLFFIVIYLHMFRGLMYGSYQKPRELVWIIGMLIYLVLMAEAFMGYVLPWGQMSFWGAKVIISLFGAVPVVGKALTEWIMGDYLPADATLNRFFALHVIALPLALLGLVVLHVFALHEVGSNNPDGVEIKKGPKGNRWDVHAPADGVPFHPYYTAKDFFYVCCLLLIAAFIIFYVPAFGGLFLEHDNFTEANRLVTPEHIKPVWYYTPFYAMLRVVPDKLGGVLTMFSAIAALFFVPWLDRGKVKSIRYRGRGFKIALFVFAFCFVWLGKIGSGPGTDINETYLGRMLTLLYFGYFIFLWVYTYFGFEKTKPVPDRVTMHE